MQLLRDNLTAWEVEKVNINRNKKNFISIILIFFFF
jgi:hypothetical protein